MTDRSVWRNPATGERSTMLTDPREHRDEVLVAHLQIEPGGRVAAPHFHPALRERFLILEGQVGFLIDGEESILGPGEHATVSPNVVHDWWQVGETTAQVIVEVVPGRRFSEAVATLFGLARDGEVDPSGMPGPLQLAVLGNEYRDTIVFADPPQIIQRLAVPPLALLGRLRGLRPMYERYLEPSEFEAAEPRALAQLTDDGRLRPFDAPKASADL